MFRVPSSAAAAARTPAHVLTWVYWLTGLSASLLVMLAARAYERGPRARAGAITRSPAER